MRRALADADRLGRDVLLHVGDGLAFADQDRLPEPAARAGFDADARGDEFGGCLPDQLGELNFHPLTRAAEEVLEGADGFDAGPGESET